MSTQTRQEHQALGGDGARCKTAGRLTGRMMVQAEEYEQGESFLFADSRWLPMLTSPMKRLIVLALLGLSAFGNALRASQLERSDVERIIAQAASRAAQLRQQSLISVTDREGYVLGVWQVGSDGTPDAFEVAGAVSRAGTAAFLSSNQNAFTSRTAGFIIQQHFPPKVRNTPPGPLVGVGLSNIYLFPDDPLRPRGAFGHSDVTFFKQIPTDEAGVFDPNARFSDVDPFRHGPVRGTRSPGAFGGGTFVDRGLTLVAPGAGVAGTSLNDPPGGVPLYKDGKLVGGLGVTGDGSPIDISTGAAIILRAIKGNKYQRNCTPGFKEGADIDEDIALAGQKGFEPASEILASRVFIGGIRIPYVETDTGSSEVKPIGSIGRPVAGFPIQKSPPPFDYPRAEFGGVAGEIRFPFRDDPLPGRIDGARRLERDEVMRIVGQAAERAGHTRAGIRQPVGVPAQVFIAVVGNPAQDDVPPPILGIFRTGDATMFSWDVAVQKARTALFFSTNKFAQSSRTVGFLAQRFYPPGLKGRRPGPYFGLQEAFLIIGFKHRANANVPNGITIFPGGFPLYRKGVLVGAIGVSGDGVDQDDIIGASGCADFLAPEAIRADRHTYRGARLPYAKFPRDPEL